MDPVGTPILVLALSIAANAIIGFFKQPKEYHGELVKRVDTLEDAHHELDKHYASDLQYILGELRNLANAINHLTAAVLGKDTKELFVSGEHRAAKR